MEADGDHFLAYYLTKEDEDAINFKKTRVASAADDAPLDDEVLPFPICVLAPALNH